MRLNPIAPANYLHDLSMGYYFLGRYKDAIEMNERALKRTPNDVFAHMHSAAAYSALGREEEARHQAQELLRLDPSFSVDKWAETIVIKDKAELERFIDDLRKAGLK